VEAVPRRAFWRSVMMARCTTARAVEGGADLRSRTTSPTLSPVKESTGRVAASARSARRIEAAGFLLPTVCAKAGVEDEGGRKKLDEERKGEEDAESERRRGEATAADGIVAALLRWGAERGEEQQPLLSLYPHVWPRPTPSSPSPRPQAHSAQRVTASSFSGNRAWLHR
jgi:hypothetical protein